MEAQKQDFNQLQFRNDQLEIENFVLMEGDLKKLDITLLECEIRSSMVSLANNILNDISTISDKRELATALVNRWTDYEKEKFVIQNMLEALKRVSM